MQQYQTPPPPLGRECGTETRATLAVCILPLGPDCATPQFRLAAASEFYYMKPMILTIATGYTINTHSPLDILC